MAEGCFLLTLKRDLHVTIKAKDEKRTKGRILGSLTWKADSIRQAYRGNHAGRRKVRKDDVLRATVVEFHEEHSDP